MSRRNRGLVPLMPKAWKQDVMILRSGGRDRMGRPLPQQEIPLPDVLVADTASSEPDQASDRTDTSRTLYAAAGVDLRSTDRVRLANGSEWAVTGDVGDWPHGVVAVLEKEQPAKENRG